MDVNDRNKLLLMRQECSIYKPCIDCEHVDYCEDLIFKALDLRISTTPCNWSDDDIKILLGDPELF